MLREPTGLAPLTKGNSKQQNSYKDFTQNSEDAVSRLGNKPCIKVLPKISR